MEPDSSRHVIRDLGLAVSRVEEEVHGRAVVSPEMWVPGTDVLRTSILATWADTLTGMLTIGHVQPRVPVTLQLDVDLHRPPAGLAEVHLEARHLHHVELAREEPLEAQVELVRLDRRQEADRPEVDPEDRHVGPRPVPERLEDRAVTAEDQTEVGLRVEVVERPGLGEGRVLVALVGRGNDLAPGLFRGAEDGGVDALAPLRGHRGS